MDFGTARSWCNTYGSGHVLPGELLIVRIYFRLTQSHLF